MINRYAIIICLCMLTPITKLFAQIPNPSFENWTAGNPDGWTTLNGTEIYVTQITDAHDGASAAQSTAETPGAGVYVVSFLYSGTSVNNYFPCDCRPDALHFWYQLHPAGGESLSAYVASKQNGSSIGGGALTLTASTSVYTEGVVNMSYFAPGNADSMAISFLMGAGSTGLFSQGTFYIVDDLEWGAAVNGISLTASQTTVLESVSPNPTQNSTSIIYSLNQSADVQLEIYDAVGRLAKVILNEKQGVGRYKAIEDFSNLSAGVYTCRLIANGQGFTKSFVVTP